MTSGGPSSTASQRILRRATSSSAAVARKVRFAAPGRGKSGGYRVVTYFGGGDRPVFLLKVFKKGDRVNLSKAEINELHEELSHLAREYREGALRHVKGR